MAGQPGSTSTAERGLIVLEARPVARRAWLADLWAHREVFAMLARQDFQTRYKRASLGLVWAVAVPVLQGAVMAVVFSKVVRLGDTDGFGVYVFSGVLAFSYFNGTLSTGVVSIVEGASLTDKVWFPRALLVLVPVVANLPGLFVSLGVLVVVTPVLGVDLGPEILVLVPAALLLVTFTAALSLVCAALHVYFRDVRFLVQASLLLWLYVTPVMYPKELLGEAAAWIDLNPLTGIVGLFHIATIGPDADWGRALALSIGATIVLLAIGLEAQRRHDRLFVDQL